MIGKEIAYFDGATECIGYLALPANAQPAPLVLIAHTWKGRSAFENNKALELAELGYAALAVDVYGGGINGSSTEENQALILPFVNNRQFFQTRLISAIEFGKTLPQVQVSKIALMGFCFGGLAAIEVARSGYELSGCISFHGLLNPLAESLNIIKTPLLVLHGEKDPMVSPESVLAFQDEMTQAQADWQFVSYGNTYHAFTNPGANDVSSGTVYNKKSDQRSWIAMKNFLQEVFS